MICVKSELWLAFERSRGAEVLTGSWGAGRRTGGAEFVTGLR